MLFGRRKRYPRPVRIQMAVQKPLYHFGRARSLGELRQRKALYFSRDYPPVDRDGAEGERLLLANAMAMNYGFAFRLSTYASLQQLFRRDVRAERETKLIVDSPHNSIYEEETRTERRRSSTDTTRLGPTPQRGCRITRSSGRSGSRCFFRVRTGPPRTSASPARRRQASLYSAPHGAGANIEPFVRRGLSQTDPHGQSHVSF